MAVKIEDSNYLHESEAAEMKSIFKANLCETYITDQLCSSSYSGTGSSVSGVMRQGLVAVLQEYLNYF